MRIALSYTIFAALATLINICSQEFSLRVYAGAYSIPFSILVGTIVGLLVKYYLDKRYIFRIEGVSVHQDARLFTLYAVMGVFTTVIFWGAEFAFDLVFQSKPMRYLGGVIGLGIGYFMKYQLDKRFVFVIRGGS
ncbi:GtrA family protein [Microbulbifer sp. YPW1]|uniref:GtrA family protein n=1 Tax=Microbulbifer sp. YPW1 TaxID=2745199 RepID=UPI00159B260D|nr:GtrA family protein [Microbulbifer sp. YPW1]QKX15655.1 GtrA family protein [Microbulbifer sp. YPW1]